MNNDSSLRLAVLIDSDNISSSKVEKALAQIAELGEMPIRRVYGDFSSTNKSCWLELIRQYALKPMQQFTHIPGKNATDIALIIDAMDLLHTAPLDGFCLLTSDSDFTGLVIRMRESNFVVYGFGEQKAPGPFRNACHQFFYVENLPLPTTITETSLKVCNVEVAMIAGVADGAACEAGAAEVTQELVATKVKNNSAEIKPGVLAQAPKLAPAPPPVVASIAEPQKKLPAPQSVKKPKKAAPAAAPKKATPAAVPKKATPPAAPKKATPAAAPKKAAPAAVPKKATSVSASALFPGIKLWPELILGKAIAEAGKGKEWVGLPGVGAALQKLVPGFDPKSYGHSNSKLSDFLQSRPDVVEVKFEEGRYYVRMKK